MKQVKGFFRFLLLLSALVTSGGSWAQSISVEDFFAVVIGKQERIDELRNGVGDVWQYLEMDNIEGEAIASGDPESYIDFYLARYYRAASKLYFEAASVASKVADFIKTYHKDTNIPPKVIEEGIAKYENMTEFLVDCGNENLNEYLDYWKKFTDKYSSNIGEEAFEYDDQFLTRYWVFD